MNAAQVPRRRIGVMIVIVTTVLLLATGFVCVTWNYFFANARVPA